MTNLKGAIFHHEREIAELRADRELAVEYLKAAMEGLDHPDSRPAGLLALRTRIDACQRVAWIKRSASTFPLVDAARSALSTLHGLALKCMAVRLVAALSA